MKKIYGIVCFLLLMFSTATQLSATPYTLSSLNPQLTAVDEQVYYTEYPLWGIGQAEVYFLRGGANQAARTNPVLGNAPTVATSTLLDSRGRTSFESYDPVTGYTAHGEYNNGRDKGNPQGAWSGYFMNYDFIAPPVITGAINPADFAPSNLTTPTANAPAVLDTAIHTQATPYRVTHAGVQYNNNGSPTGSYQITTSSVSIDDNAGAMHDLSNPAHPDYNQQLFDFWNTVAGGLTTLQGLVRVEIINENADSWGTSVTRMVMYIKPGVGTVYTLQYDLGGNQWTGDPFTPQMTEMLMAYKVGGNAGSTASMARAQVQLLDPYGATPPTQGSAVASLQMLDPYTGQPMFDPYGVAVVDPYGYRSISTIEDSAGIFTFFYAAGDTLVLNTDAWGWLPQQQFMDVYAATQVTPVISIAMKKPASLIDIYTQTMTGLPINNVSIWLQDMYAGWQQNILWASTDNYGHVTFELDPYGNYNIQAWLNTPNAPYAGGSWKGNLGTGVANVNNDWQLPDAILSPMVQQFVGLTLQNARFIDITVLDAVASPVVNGLLNVSDPWGNAATILTTDSYGFARFYDPGYGASYRIEIPSGFPSKTGFSANVPQGSLGGFVTGVAGAATTTQNINLATLFTATPAIGSTVMVQLPAGAVINGVVTDPLALPISYANLNFTDSYGMTYWTTADAYGQYGVTVPAGTVTAILLDNYIPIGSNIPQPLPNFGMGGLVDVYGNTTGGNNAIGVLLGAAQLMVSPAVPTVFNIQASQGGELSGTILDVQGKPAVGIPVSINPYVQFNPYGQLGGIFPYGFLTVWTDLNGRYASNVPSGQYQVFVDTGNAGLTNPAYPNAYLGQYGGFANGAGGLGDIYTAAIFTVAASTITTANGQLQAGGSITGTVLDPLGLPLTNAVIDVIDINWNFLGSAVVDNYGQYTVNGLPNGVFYVRLSGGWNNATGQPLPLANMALSGFVDPYGGTLGASPTQGAASFITAIGTTTTVNIQATAGAQINGTIRDSNGVGVAGLGVYANDIYTYIGVSGSIGVTDGYGHYTLTLPMGNYQLWVDTWAVYNTGNGSGFIDRYGFIDTYAANARVFTLVSGTVINNADGQIPQMGSLQVQLTDALGLVVANVTISANSLTGGYYNLQTNNNGLAILNVLPGAYSVFVNGAMGFDSYGTYAYQNGGYADGLGGLSNNWLGYNIDVYAGLPTLIKATLLATTLPPVPVPDTIAPVVTPPSAITVAALDVYGTPSSNASIAAFLAAATAIDNVAVAGNITNNAPAVFPVGMTTVTFTASDTSGNIGAATANVTINPVPITTPQGSSMIRLSDVYASPAGLVNVALSIEPYAGLGIASFNIGVTYDGTNLTLGTFTPVLPASWTCQLSSSPPMPNGSLTQQIICFTAVAADALSTVTLIQLPFTVASTVALNTVLPLTVSTTSAIYDIAFAPLPSTFVNGSISVNNKTVVYNLLSGWNLIAFPVDMGATGLADFLLAAPDVAEVWAYSNGAWVSYIAGVPAFLNSLSTIQPAKGYWVNVMAGKNPMVTVSGASVTAKPRLQPASWNLVASTAIQSSVATYATSQGANEVWGYSNGAWCSYSNTVPAFLNCLSSIQPEAGYYVKTP